MKPIARRRPTIPKEHEELPWDALLESGPEIPWDALHQFASALPGNPALLDELEDTYDEVWYEAQEHEAYGDLYIMAIIGLASDKNPDREDRERWSQLLIDKLLQAGGQEDDIAMECAAAACGNVGPAVLPHAMEALDRIYPDHAAWYHLWGVLQIAADSQDEELRERVVRTCRDALDRVEKGDLKPNAVMTTAWTLAYLNRQECVPQLRRVAAMAPSLMGGGNDIAEAADYMEGKLDEPAPPELLDYPVEDWLPTKVRLARRWFRRRRKQEELADRASDQQEKTPQPTPKEAPIADSGPDVGRNDPCPCGSGKKYKYCCGGPGA